MSSQNPSKPPLPSDYSPAMEVEAFRRNQRSDWFLEQFVSLFNESGGAIGVTLTVGGTFISGTLISPEDYFKELGSQLEEALKRSGTSADHSRKIGEFVQSRGKYEPPSEEVEKAAAKAAFEAGVFPISGTQRAYIHLKNAYVLVPGEGKRVFRGGLWRGRISAVEGFLVGEW